MKGTAQCVTYITAADIKIKMPVVIHIIFRDFSFISLLPLYDLILLSSVPVSSLVRLCFPSQPVSSSGSASLRSQFPRQAPLPFAASSLIRLRFPSQPVPSSGSAALRSRLLHQAPLPFAASSLVRLRCPSQPVPSSGSASLRSQFPHQAPLPFAAGSLVRLRFPS